MRQLLALALIRVENLIKTAASEGKRLNVILSKDKSVLKALRDSKVRLYYVQSSVINTGSFELFSRVEIISRKFHNETARFKNKTDRWSLKFNFLTRVYQLSIADCPTKITNS